VDVADKSGETPLHYAARSGSETIVVMLSRKANTLAVGKNGTADQVAMRAGHEVLAGWIAKHNFAVCPLLTLPIDLLVSIMEWLEPHDLCSVAQTCSVL
jgi:ankyrin repeat protein